MSEVSNIVGYLNNSFNKKISKKKNFNKKKTKKNKNLIHLNKHDFLIAKQVISVNLLKKIKKKLEKKLTPKNVFYPKDTSDLNKKSFDNLYKKNRTIKFWRKFPKISHEEHLQGMKLWSRKCNYIVLKNVEKLSPEIKKIKNIPRIKNITDFYFKDLKYKHVYSKVIYTFKNKKYPIDTQVFHNDLDGVKVLKIFIYLNSVKKLSEGPTQFLTNSNIFSKANQNKLANWKYRLLDKNKDKYFKKSKIISFLGKLGDAFFLNTGFYHRGSIPKDKSRMLLILTFNCHSELTTARKRTRGKFKV